MINFFERLDMYMKYSGLNDNKITVVSGISNGLLGKLRKSEGSNKKSGGMSQENISKILYSCPDLDANWLLTGKGKMILESETDKETETEETCRMCKAKDKMIQVLEVNAQLLKDKICYLEEKIEVHEGKIEGCEGKITKKAS